MRKFLSGCMLAIMAVVMVMSPCPAEAKKHKTASHSRSSSTSYNNSNSRYSGIVVEVNHQVVLYDKDSDQLRHPASLTKAMTIYMAFDAIKAGKINWNSMLYVSPHAASMPQTNIALHAGDRISVQDLITSMVVHSANDSAVVIAEALGGTEDNFAKMMTRKAHAIGMKDTVFKNANGLPDDDQVTTARDMVRLALALEKHFPDYFKLFSQTVFTHNGRVYESHNRVTRYYPGATGLKTGYIRASGFNLITTVSRDGYSLIGVVMGGKSSKSRDNHMVSLMDTALEDLKSGNYRMAGNSKSDYMDIAGFSKSGAPNLYSKVGASAADDSEPENISAEGAEDGNSTGVPAANETQVASLSDGADAAKSSPSDDARQWGIQVGTFSNSKDALMAAANAVNIAHDVLQSGNIKVRKVGAGKVELNRAHVINLSESDAREACRKLLMQHESCFVFKDDNAN